VLRRFALLRRCGARGAHLASSMVGERLKDRLLAASVRGLSFSIPSGVLLDTPKVPRGILEPRTAVGLIGWAGFLVGALGADRAFHGNLLEAPQTLCLGLSLSLCASAAESKRAAGHGSTVGKA
jgi:hypothetical protein